MTLTDRRFQAFFFAPSADGQGALRQTKSWAQDQHFELFCVINLWDSLFSRRLQCPAVGTRGVDMNGDHREFLCDIVWSKFIGSTLVDYFSGSLWELLCESLFSSFRGTSGRRQYGFPRLKQIDKNVFKPAQCWRRGRHRPFFPNTLWVSCGRVFSKRLSISCHQFSCWTSLWPYLVYRVSV